jgi:hypothetical protein
MVIDRASVADRLCEMRDTALRMRERRRNSEMPLWKTLASLAMAA